MNKLELLYLDEFENEARVIFLQCPCGCGSYADTFYLKSDVLKGVFEFKIDPEEIMPVFDGKEVISSHLNGEYMLVDIITGEFSECDLCDECCDCE